MTTILSADYIEQGFAPVITSKPAVTVPLKSSPCLALSIPCDVVFGSPKEDCRGTGICRIATSYSHLVPSVKRECRHASGLMCSNPEGSRITLLFRQSDLCPHLSRHYFIEKKALEIKHACPLPPSAVAKLGLQGRSLPAGQHQVSFGGGYYRIDFCLKDN